MRTNSKQYLEASTSNRLVFAKIVRVRKNQRKKNLLIFSTLMMHQSMPITIYIQQQVITIIQQYQIHSICIIITNQRKVITMGMATV